MIISNEYIHRYIYIDTYCSVKAILRRDCCCRTKVNLKLRFVVFSDESCLTVGYHESENQQRPHGCRVCRVSSCFRNRIVFILCARIVCTGNLLSRENWTIATESQTRG